MRVRVAPGWFVTHLTDRVVRLEKPDVLYRRLTGADGRILVRAEPGMSRDELLTKAIEMARRNDAELGLKVAAGMARNLARLGAFRRRQRELAHVFGIPGEEPSQKVYRP